MSETIKEQAATYMVAQPNTVFQPVDKPLSAALQREDLQRAIEQLPEKALAEVAQFVEFLRFKTQGDPKIEPNSQTIQTEQKYDTQENQVSSGKPPYKPVHFPPDIIDFDFTPEFIHEARKEMWARFHEEAE